MHEYRLADADRAPSKKGSQKVRGHGPSPFLPSVASRRRAFPVGTETGLLTFLVSSRACSWTSGCCAGCTTRRTTGRR
jgi:hypothetical protein